MGRNNVEVAVPDVAVLVVGVGVPGLVDWECVERNERVEQLVKVQLLAVPILAAWWRC